jgi:hypothetical protein
MGAMCVVGGFATPEANQLGAPPLPLGIRFAAVVEGLCSLGLGMAVWRGAASMIRDSLGLLLILQGIGCFLSAGSPIPIVIEPEPVARSASQWMFFGAITFALGVGVLGAYEWGRRGLVVVGSALCVALVVSGLLSCIYYREVHPALPLPSLILATLLSLVFPGGLVLYGANPTTRAHFADARARRSRR